MWRQEAIWHEIQLATGVTEASHDFADDVVQEDEELLQGLIEGRDLVILVVCLGGGAGGEGA